jgi:hypothetical protein
MQTDLTEKGKRRVTTDEGMAFAEANNMFFIETSAFTSKMVSDAFERILTG